MKKKRKKKRDKRVQVSSINSWHKSAVYRAALPHRYTILYNTQKSRYLKFRRASAPQWRDQALHTLVPMLTLDSPPCKVPPPPPIIQPRHSLVFPELPASYCSMHAHLFFHIHILLAYACTHTRSHVPPSHSHAHTIQCYCRHRFLFLLSLGWISLFLCIASDLCVSLCIFFRQCLFVFLVYAYRCVSCLLLFDNIFALCIMCFQALLIMF